MTDRRRSVDRRYPSERDPKYMMRLPGRLHARIKAAAKQNGRSMNGEIVHTLKQAYPEPVEPESLNKDLLNASMAIAERWSELLMAVGQDPSRNQELNALRAKINEAQYGPAGTSNDAAG